VLVLAGLLLAACGKSSGSPTGSTAKTNASSTGASGKQSAVYRVEHYRECMAKNGVKLAERKPGQSSEGLPRGVSAAQYKAASKKCGVTYHVHLKRFFFNPAALAPLTTYVACMHEHGIDLPPPNTHGHGPIFNTSGVNVAGTQFKEATAKCVPTLRSALRKVRQSAKH